MKKKNSRIINLHSISFKNNDYNNNNNYGKSQFPPSLHVGFLVGRHLRTRAWRRGLPVVSQAPSVAPSRGKEVHRPTPLTVIST